MQALPYMSDAEEQTKHLQINQVTNEVILLEQVFGQMILKIDNEPREALRFLLLSFFYHQ
jgi:hypothetical protein